jgi:apolipoprotein D and lipocalin family protein
MSLRPNPLEDVDRELRFKGRRGARIRLSCFAMDSRPRAAPVFAALLGAALIGLLPGCAATKPPLQTVSYVDLPRYMGDWYVIANIPYFAEKNCFDSTESYALRRDGRIDNWFTCREKSFDAPMKRKATAIATVLDRSTNARWRVRLFHIVPVQYFIVDLDSDYQWVAVAHPSRNYGWVMARGKTMSDDIYQLILGRLSAQGYDVSRFKKVPQQQDGTARH